MEPFYILNCIEVKEEGSKERERKKRTERSEREREREQKTTKEAGNTQSSIPFSIIQ